MKKIATILLLSLLVFTACTEDNDDNAQPNATVTFNFSHDWDGTTVTNSDIATTQFTNANGEVLTINRLRYLLSHFELVNANGDTFSLDGYKLIDLSILDSQTFLPTTQIPTGTYTLKLVYGFNEEENIDGIYTDLNSTSWNWPDMLGGGYHFLQFDGMYNVDTVTPMPFNFHNGTARVSTGVFEQNFVNFEFSPTITITNNVAIEIKMNIAEWFKNPNLWDLNIFDTPLMPNYDAQIMMHQNAASVFSVGEITQ